MEIAQYIQKAAEDHLKFQGGSGLPAQLADTDFYLATSDDITVIAHGAVSHEEVEYKIGVKK